MNDNSLLIGVFKKEKQVQNTIDFLKNMGFKDDQICYLIRGDSVDQFKILDNLLDLGIAEDEAKHYQSEWESGSGLLVVRHDGRRGVALNVLSLNGAKKLNFLNTSLNIPDDSSSLKEALDNNEEVYERNLPKNSSKLTHTHKSESMTQEEKASLYKLLKYAGLEHLL